jgi:GH15 family glucan-1,4-alpha-glucosidase
MGYKPIESYGVIGDLHSVALVATDGSIDWCCLPYFDSPSVFAAILDCQKGGFFRVGSVGETTNRQMYMPDTNVLLTRFLSNDGVGEVVDFMPIVESGRGCMHQIVRTARGIRGTTRFRLECRPAFDYGRKPHTVVLDPRGAIFDTGSERMALVGPTPLREENGGVVAEFDLNRGESMTFAFRERETEDCNLLGTGLDGDRMESETVRYWRRWLSRCIYEGRWGEMVRRSALVLKMLTFEPTGAIVAAATCSLPEEIGGARNWDYRYTWIRDAAFTVYAFLRLGFTTEAERFMAWLQKRVREEETVNGPLNIMYGIDGRHELSEETLDHLEGYKGSRPVRIGNGAYNQLQLDIYGELIDSIYLFDKYGTRISYDLWNQLRRMLDWVSRHWDKPDEGIWEVRGGQQQFVYSKLQCWVALDRGLRMARKYSLPVDWDRLRKERDKIYEAIMTKGWNEEMKSFTQCFGSDSIDASNLMMPLVLFLSPKDPRMLGTIDRTMEDLVSDSLVHRYKVGGGVPDGLDGGEGTFSICTFWLVEALARAGRVDEARFIFEKMLTYANHLGLYAEEIGPRGEALGNFPQAFTHLALISAAFSLNRMLGAKD